MSFNPRSHILIRQTPLAIPQNFSQKKKISLELMWLCFQLVFTSFQCSSTLLKVISTLEATSFTRGTGGGEGMSSLMSIETFAPLCQNSTLLLAALWLQDVNILGSLPFYCVFLSRRSECPQLRLLPLLDSHFISINSKTSPLPTIQSSL